MAKPTHVYDYRVQWGLNQIRPYMSMGVDAILSYCSPLGPAINMAIRPYVQNAGNHLMFEFARQMFPGPVPVVFGMTINQFNEVYKMIHLFCVLLSYGCALSIVSVAAARPMLGYQPWQQEPITVNVGKSLKHSEEGTQENVAEMAAQHEKNMMEMMKALQKQNTLALLPPEERAQFMIADRMATLLEGGHIVPLPAPATEPPATPGLQALTYSPPEMSYSQAKARVARDEAEKRREQSQNQAAVEKAMEIMKSKNKVPARVTSAFGPLAIEDAPPATTEPKGQPKHAMFSKSRPSQEQHVPPPAKAGPRLVPPPAKAAPRVIPPRNQNMLFSKSRPSNPSGTGKPKKKDMIATGKPLLPYFDISNDPYFIKT